jgi:hypothetical protein
MDDRARLPTFIARRKFPLERNFSDSLCHITVTRKVHFLASSILDCRDDLAAHLTGALTGETKRCPILTGDHPLPMIAPGNWSQPALPGNAFAEIPTTTAIIESSRIRNRSRRDHSVQKEMGPLLLQLTRRGRRRIRPSSGHRKLCRQSFRLFEALPCPTPMC